MEEDREGTGANPVVVCLDDEPRVLSAVRRALKREPYEVRVTDRIDEALRWSDDQEVAVFVADQCMPEMSGIDVLQTVGKRHPGTARVMLTGYPDHPGVLSSVGGTVQWLISKPWNDDELRRILRTLVEESKSRPTTEAPKAAAPPTGAGLRAEIEHRLGYFPPFFAPALESPEILDILWRQTEKRFLDSPFSLLLKEKIFAYLSCLRRVLYCSVVHCCALRSLGMSGAQVLRLLETSVPRFDADVAAIAERLSGPEPRAESWPEPRSADEDALFELILALVSGAQVGERCSLELRRLLGDRRFMHLILFLSYVDLCHNWTRVFSDLMYEADVRTQIHLASLLEEEPRLCSVFSFGAGCTHWSLEQPQGLPGENGSETRS